ncbi:MAG: methyltransferase domain-containing protein [Gammaproteobacteria bacterium]|nr:methyltransferase domain-containing protein [Gammaproteobacteria bacterium]
MLGPQFMLAAEKTISFARIVHERLPQGRIDSVLVVGCGDGHEAQVLKEFFGCRVTAIDLVADFEPRAGVEFRRMDAREMTFEPESFDLVYSFHALEHIVPPEQVIAGIRRVLKPGMPFCLGTPNRRRMVGYLGSADATLADKIRWNAADWRARLAGRFRNELGAHAGFTERELFALGSRIGPTAMVSDDYYRRIYQRHDLLIKLIVAMNLQQIVWPAVYAVGYKAS